MKLASLTSGRDGKLVVVSNDLAWYADAAHIAPTLQAALDDWDRLLPDLQNLSTDLEHEMIPMRRFHEHQAASPLPRWRMVKPSYCHRDQWWGAAVAVGRSEAVRRGDGGVRARCRLERGHASCAEPEPRERERERVRAIRSPLTSVCAPYRSLSSPLAAAPASAAASPSATAAASSAASASASAPSSGGG